jgi:hypothetical protein
VEVDAPGFRCKANDAWGSPDLLPVALGGTFAVSFLVSAERGVEAVAGTPVADGDFGIAGATGADGIAGALGASGGGAANEGGLGIPGGTPTTEGGFGATGATPEIEGGLGAGGGLDKPATEGAFGATGAIPGGFGRGGPAGGSPVGSETDSGAPGFCIGLGGRFIIAVSRGLDASG